MARKKDTQTIKVLHQICCGLDVHKMSITACLLVSGGGEKEEVEIREFGTFTKDLITLRDWLLENHCPVVVIESTGVYWRPVHNILEGFLEVALVNARHVKNVPGRKTDVADAVWLAGLLRHGLVKSSFIPEKKVRHWRELETLRKSHIQTVGDYKRRVHKLFETANIKIDSVVCDLFGVTGRNLIDLLCDEKQNPRAETIEQCARGSLKSKVQELVDSIKGFFEDHHRFQLKAMMRIIGELELQVQSITQRLRQLMEPHKQILERLDEIPGINEIAAQSILSQTGETLKEFHSAGALCTWAGLCPGNNKSANKQKSGRHSVISHPLKTILVEIAWAATKKKDSYYREKYYRLRSRLGPRKAIVAIGHRILKAIYYIIKRGEPYKELGQGYLSKKSKNKNLTNLAKQAKKLGFTLVPVEA